MVLQGKQPSKLTHTKSAVIVRSVFSKRSEFTSRLRRGHLNFLPLRTGTIHQAELSLALSGPHQPELTQSVNSISWIFPSSCDRLVWPTSLAVCVWFGGNGGYLVGIWWCGHIVRARDGPFLDYNLDGRRHKRSATD